jgi:cyclopropane fatty-acyl-phospholipid synthase-like methyltransferase
MMMAMNETDRKLHAAIHQGMMSVPPERIFSPRVSVFDRVESKLNISIGGKVLDMGCGSGYASIWLAKNKPVKRVYALEASEAAVKELLPRNIKYHGVGDKVEAVLGSFDALPVSDLDFVVSFGALHHSSCLLSTMRSISASLREGGYLLAQEPVMPNMTTNGAYIAKYDVMEEKHGLKIRNGDRQDCFFREAEYITAAAFAGLDLILYENYSAGVALPVRAMQWLQKKLRQVLQKKRMASGEKNGLGRHTKSVIPKILVFRKSTTSYIPHLWAPLAINSRGGNA